MLGKEEVEKVKGSLLVLGTPYVNVKAKLERTRKGL